MPNLFDEFDLELQKINMEITPYSDSSSDSIAFCGGNSGGVGAPSRYPTCFDICG